MKAIVIGNGFDLYHGLQTRYSDFRDWLSENHPDDLNDIEEAFPADREVLWSNFESCIGDLAEKDPQRILDLPPQERERLEAVYRRIPDLFLEWAEGIDRSALGVPIQSIKDLFSPDDMCLDFNYTDTVDRLYNTEHVLYIHSASPGMVTVGHSRGIGPVLQTAEPTVYDINLESPEPPVERINDDPDVDWEENRKRMNANLAVKSLFKNPEENIRRWRPCFDGYRSADTIVILGWSLGREDRAYMDELLRGSTAEVYVAVRDGGLERNFIDYEKTNPGLMNGRRFRPIGWGDLGQLRG